MTGYGKAVVDLPDKKVSIEVRSLNSKQLDLNLRTPAYFRSKETELRQLISARVIRGKVDFSVNLDSQQPLAVARIDHALAREYYNEMKALALELGMEASEVDLRTVLSMPDVVKSTQSELTEAEWQAVLVGVNEALDAFEEFRRQEGASLAKDLLTRVDLIEQHHAEIPAYETERVEKIRQRLEANLADTVGKDKVDANRFEQELIYYLEKLDINEEKVRLTNHISYFRETVAEEEAPGRKLAFIAQEMGREINTMGSKSNQAQMQRLVVMMKDELEKIKEQVLNVL